MATALAYDGSRGAACLQGDAVGRLGVGSVEASVYVKGLAEMTQDEMDNDQLQAAGLLGKARLTVDRSRHETTIYTTLWFMDGKSQRGSATRYRTGWRTCRMFNGSPSSERLFDTLAEVVEHIVTQDPLRFLPKHVVTQTRDDPRFRVVKVTGKVR